MIAARIKHACALAVGVFSLAACDPVGVPRTSPVPTARPPQPVIAPLVKPPSAKSLALRDYYARVEQTYTAQGLLRVDGGGPDTPFSRRQLVDNFIKIALFEEFTQVGSRLVAQERESRLHRWKDPVRIKVEFGDSVPLAQRQKDSADITRYADRLARLTGHPVSHNIGIANFHVFIVNEDERQQIGPALQAIIPDITPTAIGTVQSMQRSTLCLVFARDPGNDGIYTDAVAVIRAEHPDLLRLSCIHEELAQGLGLSNDSPAARPSVFNDDEEFGLLTTHDELLLRMLYDPRLRTGMTASQARPIANQIALDLLGGDS